MVHKAEKSIKYLVAVYTVVPYVTGSYTLGADCKVIFTTCQSDTTIRRASASPRAGAPAPGK